VDEKLVASYALADPGEVAANVLGDVVNPEKNLVGGWLADLRVATLQSDPV
jgi:hypothetical protein